jgi:hypothetical protein
MPQFEVTPHNIILKAAPRDSARAICEKFCAARRSQSAGVLCVRQALSDALAEKNFRKAPQPMLRGVALNNVE